MERNCSGRRSEVRRRRRLSRSVVVVDPFPFRECVRERERKRERVCLVLRVGREQEFRPHDIKAKARLVK